jgi:hypothetical protein
MGLSLLTRSRIVARGFNGAASNSSLEMPLGAKENAGRERGSLLPVYINAGGFSVLLGLSRLPLRLCRRRL